MPDKSPFSNRSILSNKPLSQCRLYASNLSRHCCSGCGRAEIQGKIMYFRCVICIKYSSIVPFSSPVHSRPNMDLFFLKHNRGAVQGSTHSMLQKNIMLLCSIPETSKKWFHHSFPLQYTFNAEPPSSRLTSNKDIYPHHCDSHNLGSAHMRTHTHPHIHTHTPTHTHTH